MENARNRALLIMAQHAQLERGTSRLQELLSSSFSWTEVAEELLQLHRLLGEHFELEESGGGYMTDVRDVLPSKTAALDELARAHARLEGTLREIRVECALGRDAERLRELFQDWLRDLVRHEKADQRLCEEAFGTLPIR